MTSQVADESVVAECVPSPIPNCNHEVDTRIVIHVAHALQQGWKIVKVRTMDTDIIVVLVGVFNRVLQSQPLVDIWVAFGVGNSYWQARLAFEEVTETLAHLASHPFESLDADCEHFRKIERLIVIVYDKASTSLSIKQTRRELFCLKNAKMEKMPLTHVQNALRL